MHSKKKMQERYPWVLPYLKYLYTGRDLHLNGTSNVGNGMMSTNETKNCKQRGAECDEYAEYGDPRFKTLNMSEFYFDTLPDIFLPYCEFHR